MKRILYIFALLLSFFCVKSQNDIINTISGEKIECKITKEDSSKVYFKLGGSLSSIEAFIERTKIKSIEYARSKTESIPTTTLIVKENNEEKNKDLNLPKKPEKDPVNNLSFNIGVSYPQFDFKSEKLDTNQYGPGKTGQVFNFTLDHYLNKSIGVNFKIQYANNELNTKPITNKYILNTDSSWNADRTYYRTFGFNFGLVAAKKIKDLVFTARLNAGYVTMQYPELYLYVSSTENIRFYKTRSDAVSISGDLGVSYNVYKDLNVIINFSYINANFKFKEVLYQKVIPDPVLGTKKSPGTIRDLKQSYQSIYATFGVGYWF